MLQSEYKRDMQKNYIVLKGEENKSDYSMKMLANNKILGFLDMEIRSIDYKDEYYYDITGKQTMDIVFRKETLKEAPIKRILSEIIMTIKRSRDYLLLEDNFILSPQYIYMNLDGTDIKLIYFSGHEESVGEQLLRLIEYMMDKVDYKDKTAVYLIYGIYKMCREEDCTFERMLEYLDGNESLEHDLERYEAREQEILRQEEAFIDMEEEVESEEEKKKYPLWVWACCVISVIVSVGVIALAANKGILFDFVTGKIMLGKMAIVLGVIGALEAYCLLRLLDEKNMVAYIDKKTEYIKPVEEKRKVQKRDRENNLLSGFEMNCRNDNNEFYKEVKVYEENQEQATVVLAERKSRYVLLPEQKDTYMPIPIQEFPFFVGTLKTKVDYAINSRSVSRFHAKIEQENEQFFLSDMNSTNGTFVNEKRLEPNEKVEITLGDFISFADVVYRFYRE